MRLFKTMGLILSLSVTAQATAEFKEQCHKSGGSNNGMYTNELPRQSGPDRIVGGADVSGNDVIRGSFDSQSLTAQAQTKTKSLNPRVAGGYTKEQWKALPRKERRKIIAAFLKAKAQEASTLASSYIQANSAGSGTLNADALSGAQTAFDQIKARLPASLAPATVTPSTNYDVLLGENSGAGASR